jgi:hypothetical protein
MVGGSYVKKETSDSEGTKQNYHYVFYFFAGILDSQGTPVWHKPQASAANP